MFAVASATQTRFGVSSWKGSAVCFPTRPSASLDVITRTQGVIMGHHISAVLLRGSFDEQRARAFDMKAIRLTSELTMFPLSARYTDFWADKLGMPGFVSDIPLLNSNVIHHMVNAIAREPLFALIETD